MLKQDLEKRIHFLESGIRKYYRANYEAKRMAGLSVGVYCCSGDLYGNEEYLIIPNIENFKQIIKNLPLWDYGC